MYVCWWWDITCKDDACLLRWSYRRDKKKMAVVAWSLRSFFGGRKGRRVWGCSRCSRCSCLQNPVTNLRPLVGPAWCLAGRRMLLLCYILPFAEFFHPVIMMWIPYCKYTPLLYRGAHNYPSFRGGTAKGLLHIQLPDSMVVVADMHDTSY